MINQVELMRVLLNDTRLKFRGLYTVGTAISAELENGQMAQAAVQLANEHGWICTRHSGSIISIETSQPAPSTLMLPHTFYHVSTLKHRTAIATGGLQPQKGGSTSLKRFYAPRLHLAVNLRDAFQFVHHQIKPLGCLNSEIDTFDIYEVPVNAGFESYNDDHFNGRGVWIETGLPASGAKLLVPDQWHPLYRAMYPEDFKVIVDS